MALAQRWTNGNEKSAENDLYKDLLEIFPLMETFMDNRGSYSWTSSARQASLIVTPAPVRQRVDRKPLQKVEVVSGLPKENHHNHHSRPKSSLSDDTHRYRLPSDNRMSWNGCEDPELSQKQTSRESSDVFIGKGSQQYDEDFVQEVLDENSRLRAMLKKGPWDEDEVSSRVAVAEELGVLRSKVAALNHMLEAEDCRNDDNLFLSKSVIAPLKSSYIWNADDSFVWPSELIERADRAKRQYLAAIIAAQSIGQFVVLLWI
ncbi:hypothetical protein AXG93_3810s1130 [Marchantia polymorpha subsp. ruderalis]|uniref:Uncharacterized protein n=1 Tax=Marchantia polymorpha subsp. ruderalis TaxID=1480154 RepID=A0A176VCQ3_MARPO|nr:hypothetical protein AXG93_3810s1130 [Marchantia polymorpha subsp. ruderalis]